MLRLTTVSRSASQAVLQVVGWVVGDDVSLLEREIERKLQGSQRLVLDLDGTRAIDTAGLAMLERRAPQGVQLQGGSAFLRALLETRGLPTASASPRPTHRAGHTPREGDPMTSSQTPSVAGTYLYELPDWEGLAILTETHFTWLLTKKPRAPFRSEATTDAEKARAYDGAFAEAGTYQHVGPARITGTRLFATNPAMIGKPITWDYEVDGDLHRYWVLQPDGSRGPMGTSRRLASAEQAASGQAIRTIVDRWFAAENRRSVADTLAFVAQDIALQPPEHPQVEGREAFGQFMERLFESQVSVGGGTWKVEVSASGDLAYGIGPNHVVVRGPEGEVASTGKWLLVWRREQGEWNAVAMSYSGDGPER